jgi:preprotein translocase subunit YajC
MLVATASSLIIPIYIVLFGALYYFYLRPRSQKQKAARLESKKVEVGQRAQTIGGFVGTVIKDDGEFITLRSSSGAELDFIPSAIARRFDPIVHDEAADDSSTEGDAK